MTPEMLKSAMILAIAGLAAAALRNRSAAIRHAVWTAGLLAALAVPMGSLLLPEWNNEIAGHVAAVLHLPAQAGAWSAATLPPASGSSLPQGWSIKDYAIAVWFAGTAFGFLIILCGAGRLAWIAIRSEPMADPRWSAIAEEVRRAHGIRRQIRLLENASVPFLGTWGVVVPRVLVPANARAWSDERVRMVLGHELAHIRRHDWMIQVLAESARAIYWFNPLFWLACSRLRRESEHACDDAVLRMGTAGTHYAEELLDLTRTLGGRHHLQSPILAMAQPSHLERRLVALLNPSLNRLAATPWAVIVVLLAAVALTLPLAALRAPEKDNVENRLDPAATVAQPGNTSATLPSLHPSDSSSGSAEARGTAAPVRQSPEREGASRAAAPGVPNADVAVSPAVESTTVIEQTRAALTTAGAVQNGASLNQKPQESDSVTVAGATAMDAPDSAASERYEFQCKVTPSTRTTRTDTMKSTSFGDGPWHISEDRVLWVWDQPYVAGREVNTIWMRPVNAEILISGRRLDAEAPVLSAKARSDYASGYLATGLTFPSAGCWEITATTGDSRLTFITRVENR